MKQFCLCLVVAGLLIPAGCGHADNSPIVTAFHRGGGGDLNHSTTDSISAFLAQHGNLRKQLTPLCAQREASAPADWATTGEGRVCASNARANFFAKPELKSDGVKF
jgi:hypothetical protein